MAATAIMAGLGLATTPRDAQAIIGIDDALLGAVVVAVASLGGYALYNQFSGNLGLQAVGASFGNYVSSAPNRTAAAAAAAQIAATYGLTTTQERFSTAADNIASGAGAFADAMAAASESGRLALDGIVSGTGDLVGAFRELVKGWLSSGVVGDSPQAIKGLTTVGSGDSVLPFDCYIASAAQLAALANTTLPTGYSSGWLYLMKNWQTNRFIGRYILSGIDYCEVKSTGGVVINTLLPSMRASLDRDVTNNTIKSDPWSETTNTVYSFSAQFVGEQYWYMTPDLVGAIQLPAVDKPADVPDVIGAGWDSVPLATDMVISPTTGEVVSAGSVPLPTGIPTTAGDYAAALQGALAGVVTDAIALPLSISVPVTVATPLGVETMPLSQAISTETSLQLDYAPDIPISPVLPPVDVPEGPWTPAIDLPFTQVWPFNMIYSFIDTLGALGNAG